MKKTTFGGIPNYSAPSYTARVHGRRFDSDTRFYLTFDFNHIRRVHKKSVLSYSTCFRINCNPFQFSPRTRNFVHETQSDPSRLYLVVFGTRQSNELSEKKKKTAPMKDTRYVHKKKVQTSRHPSAVVDRPHQPRVGYNL